MHSTKDDRSECRLLLAQTSCRCGGPAAIAIAIAISFSVQEADIFPRYTNKVIDALDALLVVLIRTRHLQDREIK